MASKAIAIRGGITLTNNSLLGNCAIQLFNSSIDTDILDLIEMESPQRSEDLKWKAERTLKRATAIALQMTFFGLHSFEI